MNFRITSKGWKSVYTGPKDIERWTPKFIARLHATGPRFVSDLRKREHGMVVDRALKHKIVRKIRVIGGEIVIPMIDDYDAWVAAGRPYPDKRPLGPRMALQRLVRGTVVERLVTNEGHFLLRHVNDYVSRLEDAEGDPLFLVCKRDGYTPRSLSGVLHDKCGSVRFMPGRALIYDPNPKRVARAAAAWSEVSSEVRDLRELIPDHLLGPI